jgi:hypothetical protein
MGSGEGSFNFKLDDLILDGLDDILGLECPLPLENAVRSDDEKHAQEHVQRSRGYVQKPPPPPSPLCIPRLM